MQHIAFPETVIEQYTAAIFRALQSLAFLPAFILATLFDFDMIFTLICVV
jgi:hypothetical protein